jgi:hypothetical protein
MKRKERIKVYQLDLPTVIKWNYQQRQCMKNLIAKSFKLIEIYKQRHEGGLVDKAGIIFILALKLHISLVLLPIYHNSLNSDSNILNSKS